MTLSKCSCTFEVYKQTFVRHSVLVSSRLPVSAERPTSSREIYSLPKIPYF